jgi:hypothetical protein
VLRLEIGSSEPNSMKPIFCPRPGVRAMAVHIGKLRGDLVMFEAFEMQEFNNMTLLQLCGRGTLVFCKMMSPGASRVLPRETSIGSHIVTDPLILTQSPAWNEHPPSNPPHPFLAISEASTTSWQRNCLSKYSQIHKRS